MPMPMPMHCLLTALFSLQFSVVSSTMQAPGCTATGQWLASRHVGPTLPPLRIIDARPTTNSTSSDALSWPGERWELVARPRSPCCLDTCLPGTSRGPPVVPAPALAPSSARTIAIDHFPPPSTIHHPSPPRPSCRGALLAVLHHPNLPVPVSPSLHLPRRPLGSFFRTSSSSSSSSLLAALVSTRVRTMAPTI